MPRESLTPRELETAICYSIMNAWDFTYTRRLEWEIWASKNHPCPDCQSPEYKPCVHLGELKRGLENPAVNKRPHDARVDWTQLLNGLKQRGYYREVIEREVRKRVR